MKTIDRPCTLPVGTVACAVLFAGCLGKHKSNTTSGTDVRVAAPASPVAVQSATEDDSSSEHRAVGDHFAHPPIDCPLRKQGIDDGPATHGALIADNQGGETPERSPLAWFGPV